MRFLKFNLLLLSAILFYYSGYGQNSTAKSYFLKDENYQASKSQLLNLHQKNRTDHQTAYYLGRIATIEKEHDQAIEYFQQASDLQPQNSKYHLWLGRAYGVKAIEANIFKKAILAGRVKDEMEKAVALDPENLEARKDLLRFYSMAPGVMGGGEDKALNQANEIKKRDEVEGCLALGQIYLMKKDYTKAEQVFLAGIQKNNQQERLYSMLALTYQRQNQNSKAFETLEKLLAIRPDYINGYAQMGLLVSSTGERFERGISCLQKYSSLYSHNPEEGQYPPSWVHYRLGVIYEKQGKIEPAKEAYHFALKNDADYKPAKKALKRLNK